MDELSGIAAWLQATGPYGIYVTWNQLSVSRSKETHGWQHQGDSVGSLPARQGPR
jgi:hypothetical protein